MAPILDALSKVEEVAKNLEPPFEKIKETLADDAKENFDAERDPDGNQWAKLSPATVREKRQKRIGRKGRKASEKILQESGDLHDAITTRTSKGDVVPFEEIRGNEMEVGVESDYAGFHMTGTKKNGRPYMPARPFWGIGERTADKVAETVADHVEREIAKCFDA